MRFQHIKRKVRVRDSHWICLLLIRRPPLNRFLDFGHCAYLDLVPQKVRDGEDAIARSPRPLLPRNFRCGRTDFRDLCDLCGERLINEKRARLFEYFVEFLRAHFSN